MRQTILHVDDNPVNLQFLSGILSERYGQLCQAANGRECLQILRHQVIDLLLLDLNMPEMSGFDVLKELPRLPGTHRPTVIVVSSDTYPQTISRAFQLGAADYVATPFNRDELLARVRTHLTLRSREQHLEELVNERTQELTVTNEQLKATHGQLVQAEKMASLGQLAAGLAHEVNNPVGYIHSNLESLKGYISDLMGLLETYEQLELNYNGPNAQKLLKEQKQTFDLEFVRSDISHLIEESLNGTERVTNIVKDLNGFSHPAQSEKQAFNLNSAIASTLNIVNAQLKYKTQIIKRLENLPEVYCIASQISQVLLNLLINAGQAIEDHGTIEITTGLQKAASGKPGVFISISDDGKGMKPDELSKVFDPFFTTKSVGDGTGLGLSVSYGIVQNHGGQITVTSTEGQGSCFTVWLPLVQEENSLTRNDVS